MDIDISKISISKKLFISERAWNFGPLDKNFINVNKIALKSKKIFKKLKIKILKKKINSFKKPIFLNISNKAINILS